MNKNALISDKLVEAASMAADYTSPAVSTKFLDNVGFQLNFTGTPVGTFAIQVSADYAENQSGVVTNAGNWIDLVLPAVPVAAGAADQIYIDVFAISAPWMRVFYDRTSGTGSLDVFVNAKSI